MNKRFKKITCVEIGCILTILIIVVAVFLLFHINTFNKCKSDPKNKQCTLFGELIDICNGNPCIKEGGTCGAYVTGECEKGLVCTCESEDSCFYITDFQGVCKKE